MRSLDYLEPEQRKAIALRYWNQAIADLPLNPSRDVVVKTAIIMGKSLQLIESDFEGINV